MGRKVKVTLQPVMFRKRDQIAVKCIYCTEVDEVVREFEDAEWSSGYRFWHIPYKQESLKALINSLKSIAVVDHTAFVHFQPKDNKLNKDTTRKKLKVSQPSAEQISKLLITKNNFEKKGYSEGTVKIYYSLLQIFFGFFKERKDTELTVDDVDIFMDDYIKKNGFTKNYKRLMANAIRCYYKFNGNPYLANYRFPIIE